MSIKCLHADCRKRHVFCKKNAKAAPLTAAGEAGVRAAKAKNLTFTYMYIQCIYG